MNERIRKTRRAGSTVGTAAIVGASFVAAWIALAACSDNAEGERCQTASSNGGNDDCNDGLVCLTKTQVSPPYNNSDRCCPPDRSQATHPGCKLLTNPIGTGQPPADTGPPPQDSGADTTEAAATDAADADAAAPDAADAADGD